jgi:hypothetical protein
MTDPKTSQGPESDRLGTEESDSLITSVRSSTYDYRKEHGRTYHSYKEGNYPFPNDENELERLDLQHLLFANVQDEKLYLSPLENPKEVLDIGTGTGEKLTSFPFPSPIEPRGTP